MNSVSHTVVANRIPPVEPVAVHTKYPRFLYYQGAKDVPSKIVKSEAEELALGEEWGPFPFTYEPVDRTPQANPEGLASTIESAGREFPMYMYHQRAKNVAAKIVQDPEEAAKLGPDWGTLPFSEERFLMLKRLDAKQAELKALESKPEEQTELEAPKKGKKN
jgi:hypothetical protein